MPHNPFDVYLEVGTTRVFACAVDWPGWCRSGKDEASAVQALFSYASRYAKIMQAGAIPFTLPGEPMELVIVDRIKGNYATNFGTPDVPPPMDFAQPGRGDLERFTQVLAAGWKAFDGIAASAQGKELRKGPRGGGRDLTEIVSHVALAEKSYLRRLGWTGEIPAEPDSQRWMGLLHREIIHAIPAAARGEYPEFGPHGGKRWPVRYFVRRSAWHVLDHAWEIEDRVM